MKTIKQISDEIGVSKQAVYKRTKGKLYPTIHMYIHTIDDTLYIDEIGETIIKNDFGYIDATSNSTPMDTYMDTQEYAVESEENTDDFFKNQIEFLNKELEKEREHNRSLNNKLVEQSNKIIELAEQITGITKNSQLLLGREQEKNYIVGHETEVEQYIEPHKKGFWSKIFNK